MHRRVLHARGAAVVPIEELLQLDLTQGELRVPVVIAGGHARALLTRLEPHAGGVLSLGEVRGLRVFAHLYPIDTNEPGGNAAFWAHLPHTAWLVVAAGPPGDDRASWRVFEELSRVLDAQRRDVRVCLFGDAEIARFWRAYGGPEPLAVSLAGLDLVKPLVKDALTRLRGAR